MIKRLVLTTLFITLSFNAFAFETDANYAILMDFEDNTILYEKQSDRRMAPASMSKLMTLYVLFDRLKKGVITLDDRFTVSKKAWKKGGSKMFLKHREKVRVEDLIRGVIIHSGNDACITIAEGLEGSEKSFADEMNYMAQKLGLTESNFVNSTGWPDPNHRMTTKDLAMLAKHIIQDFPQYYGYFNETTFTYNGITQKNRNTLITRKVGVDGLKTGHTNESGFGLVASAARKDRRLITVVNGLTKMSERPIETERLLHYGFRSFIKKPLYKKGEVVDVANVWFGTSDTVGLVADQDIKLTLYKHDLDKVEAYINYAGPLPTPIKKNSHIANLIINTPHMNTRTIPLYAKENIEAASLFSHIWKSAKYHISILN